MQYAAVIDIVSYQEINEKCIATKKLYIAVNCRAIEAGRADVCLFVR